jgi:Zn finger protein HypA/HybF involved in hydrogenase expression
MDYKTKQLGMPFGTATSKLRKLVMFDLMKKLGLDICFRCNKKIEDIRELSLEHKIPWRHSDNPVELFFNLENVSFSHLSCNSACGSKPNRIVPQKGKRWCKFCKKFLDEDLFPENYKAYRCRECHTKNMDVWREKTGKKKGPNLELQKE